MAKINVALDSFDLWLEDDTNLEHCAKAVAALALSRRSLDFELSCSVLDLTSLFSQFPRKFNCIPRYLQKHLLKERLSSIQVPALRSIPRKLMPQLVSSINRIVDYGLVKEFSIDPDQTWEEDWEELFELIHPSTCFSVMNVAFSASSVGMLEETSQLLQRFPRLKCSFDLNRWLVSGGDTDSVELTDFLATFGCRISKVYFSVPTSRAPYYRGGAKETTHHLACDSGCKISPRFYEATVHIPYVVQGRIPPNRLDLALREFDFITQRNHSDKSKYSSAVAA